MEAYNDYNQVNIGYIPINDVKDSQRTMMTKQSQENQDHTASAVTPKMLPKQQNASVKIDSLFS